MKTKLYAGIALITVVTLLFSGCTQENQKTETVQIAGSTTLQPIAMSCADSYQEQNPKIRITIRGGGSGTGVKMVGEGSVDIGAASREVKESEKENYPAIVEHAIASDAIAAVVHPSNTLDDISLENLRKIFSGEIKNFREIGGPDLEIVVVIREDGSGTRSTFEDIVMEDTANAEGSLQKQSNGAMKAAIENNENAIGYIGIGYIDPSVKAVSINGVTPTKETVSDNTYPISRRLYLLTNGEPTGTLKDFIDFVLSEEGQKLIEEEGFIQI